MIDVLQKYVVATKIVDAVVGCTETHIDVYVFNLDTHLNHLEAFTKVWLNWSG